MSRNLAAAMLYTGFGAVILAIVAGWTLLIAFVLMVAWNVVVPPVFGWPELTFWQAFALSVLLNVVAGAFRLSVKVTKS